MRAVDTNVLVRLLVADDPVQTAAAEAFAERGAWVSHLVLVEATWVLRSVYEVEPRRIADAIAMLLDSATFAVQDADVVAAALEGFRKRPRVGFSDHLILQVARNAGHLPLGTFDRDLAKVEGAERI